MALLFVLSADSGDLPQPLTADYAFPRPAPAPLLCLPAALLFQLMECSR